MTDGSSASASPTRLAERAADQRRSTVMEVIEDVALELFADRPMADVTVEEIATAAGTSIRTLYRHFATKEDILARYPARGAAVLADLLRARPAAESLVEALREAIAASTESFASEEFDRWLAAMMHSPSPERVAQASAAAMESALTEAIAERAGLSSDDLWPSIAGGLCATAMHHGYLRWITGRGDLMSEVMAALDIAMRGLVATAPKGRRP